MATVRFSIDLLSVERRNQTLGLLVLTGLSGVEIFFGKLTGVLMIQLCTALALLPCFAVTFVLGGVQARYFLAAASFVPNVILLTMAISLAASAMSRDEDDALVLASVIAGVIGAGGPAVYYVWTWFASTSPSQTWLLLARFTDLIRSGTGSRQVLPVRSG